MIALFLASAWCSGAALQVDTSTQTSAVVPVDASGEGILERALKHRESIRSGVVLVHQNWDLGHGVMIERLETGYFDTDRYRLDIRWDSGFLRFYEVRQAPTPDLFAVLIWNGRHVLRRWAGAHTTEFSLRPIRETEFPFYNVRLLGIPLVLSAETDPRQPYRGAEVVSVRQEGDLFALGLKLNRDLGDGVARRNTSMSMTVDASKGWSIVGYALEEDAWGIHWSLRGESIPANYDGVWFPQWHRHEQYRNGQLDWAREYQVLEADFNIPLDPDLFTWKGTGIPRGQTIISYAADAEHMVWDGSEAIPWHTWLARHAREEGTPASARP